MLAEVFREEIALLVHQLHIHQLMGIPLLEGCGHDQHIGIVGFVHIGSEGLFVQNLTVKVHKAVEHLIGFRLGGIVCNADNQLAIVFHGCDQMGRKEFFREIMQCLQTEIVVHRTAGQTRPAVIELPVHHTVATEFVGTQMLGCHLDGLALHQILQVNKLGKACRLAIAGVYIIFHGFVTAGTLFVGAHHGRIQCQFLFQGIGAVGIHHGEGFPTCLGEHPGVHLSELFQRQFGIPNTPIVGIEMVVVVLHTEHHLGMGRGVGIEGIGQRLHQGH